MKEHEEKEIILETLKRINSSHDGDPNALLSKTGSTTVAPEGAYCELIQNLLELWKS